MAQPPRTVGHGMSINGARIFGVVMSLFVGAIILVAPIGMIGLDVMTGPAFMEDYASVNGLHLGGLSLLVPYAFSFATTGLQYTLFDRLDYGLRGTPPMTKALIIVAGVVAIGDTVMDVGGMFAWKYPEAEAANIIPHNPDPVYATMTLIFGVLCLVHEPLMQRLLARDPGNLANARFPGAKIIAGCVSMAGYITNIVKVAGMWVGGVSMIVMDVILTPQLGTGGASTFGMWVLSLVMTAVQYMLWEHNDLVLFRDLRKHDRAYLAVGWALAALDTGLDVVGFTTAVYGHGSVVLVPEQPTVIWLLGDVIVAAICFAGERMLREMTWRPKDGESPDPGFGGGSPDPFAGGGSSAPFGGGGFGGSPDPFGAPGDGRPSF